MSSTRNSNLESRIAGSSLRRQLQDGCHNSLLAWFICLLKMKWPAPAVQKNDRGTKSEGGKNFSAHISMRRPHDLNAGRLRHLHYLDKKWLLKIFLRFYTYGDLPLESHLESIESKVLRHFHKISVTTDIPHEPRWTEPVSYISRSKWQY